MSKVKAKKKSRVWRTLKPYLFVAPAILGVLIYTIYPAIRMIIWSLFYVNQINPSKNRFVGLDNYKTILTDPDFLKCLKNTGVYTFWTVVILLLSAIILAFYMNKRRNKLTGFTQAVIFLPHVISMVSIGLIFSQMMNINNGLFNTVLEFFGFEKCAWTNSTDTAMMSVILVAIWKGIGYYTLLVMGALAGIPDSIYEAAALDDAGSFVTMRKITIPMISPQLFFTLVVMTIGSFKVFETVRTMTGGGPNNATNTLVYYIYTQMFRQFDLSRASTAGVILMILVGIMTIFYFKALSKKVHYQ